MLSNMLISGPFQISTPKWSLGQIFKNISEILKKECFSSSTDAYILNFSFKLTLNLNNCHLSTLKLYALRVFFCFSFSFLPSQPTGFLILTDLSNRSINLTHTQNHLGKFKEKNNWNVRNLGHIHVNIIPLTKVMGRLQFIKRYL